VDESVGNKSGKGVKRYLYSGVERSLSTGQGLSSASKLLHALQPGCLSAKPLFGGSRDLRLVI
jgi:hypothetical protein